jgi:hypothetical protein
VTIHSKLEGILQQNRAERIANTAHDEKTIAGCVGDLGDSLTEYQVIRPNLEGRRRILTVFQIAVQHELLRMSSEMMVSSPRSSRRLRLLTYLRTTVNLPWLLFYVSDSSPKTNGRSLTNFRMPRRRASCPVTAKNA